MDGRPFQPDWRLPPADAMAVVLRIALHRRGVECGANLETDEQWTDLCAEIIRGMETSKISPIKIVEMPRQWDQQ